VLISSLFSFLFDTKLQDFKISQKLFKFSFIVVFSLELLVYSFHSAESLTIEDFTNKIYLIIINNAKKSKKI
jgi:hypothetical protein